jgi:hypothetical protein
MRRIKVDEDRRRSGSSDATRLNGAIVRNPMTARVECPIAGVIILLFMVM